MTDINSIVEALKQERDRIVGAIHALAGGSRGSKGTNGPGSKAGKGRRRGKRMHSAASRKKLSDAAKARWAKAKRSGRNSL